MIQPACLSMHCTAISIKPLFVLFMFLALFPYYRTHDDSTRILSDCHGLNKHLFLYRLSSWVCHTVK